MPKKIRVYELARELGMENKEALDLCLALGIGVKSHSSSVEDAQADRVRRKAEREGLIREPIPEPEAKPAAKEPEPTPAAPEPTPAESAPKPRLVRSAPTPPPPPPVQPSEAPAQPAPERPRPEPAERPAPSAPPQPSSAPPQRPAPSPARPRPASAPQPGAEAASATKPATESKPSGDGQPSEAIQPPGESKPTSSSGKPIPPPPGRPTSPTGKPIPPPPGGRRPPPGPSGPRPMAPGVRNRPGYTPSTSPRPAGGGAGPSGPARPGAGGRGGGVGPPGGRFGGPGSRGGPGGRGRPQQRSRRRRRRTAEELEQPNFYAPYVPSEAPVPEGEIIVERGSTARELGPKLNRSAADVVRFLLQQGEMVTANQPLSDDAIELFCAEVGGDVRLVDAGEEKEAELQSRYFEDDEDEDEENLRPRPPVITVMGHVDHGKTLLLDRIREADVVSGEAGGITQHIGAYQTEHAGRLITFIDTPGHEAFTAMRARGAQVTDIAVLVVAADDGVMPQTVEAINHAKAADVPVVVAVNKIDREDADANRVKQQLSDHGLIPEEWGGDTVMVEVSALQRTGIDDLLEHLILVADVEELVANPEGLARGTVLEGYLDPGRGPMATVIVERGTLRVGDPVVMGASWGRVRALIDDRGDNVKEALPSTPVQVLGLSEVPTAGDELRVTPDDKTARTIGDLRSQRYRSNELRRSPMLPSAAAAGAAGAAKLEDIFEQISRGETATLNLVLKADVHGSLEALTESLNKLEREEVKLNFVHRAVGGITENDVQLASASSATIIGFNVRPDRKGRDLAEAQDVDIRTYEIIYQILEDIESAMVGMLKPEYEEVVTGEAEVLKVFGIPRIGKIAGCAVRSGVITRGSKVRFLRDGVIIWKGAINSLRREKDDVREVRQGFECGVGLSDFQNLQEGDIIETYEEREIPRS
ncbi:MAG: translation initiation factor IF-2 [Actinobacteria bacterium]|nr:translation initiation factor IF-2 [Actinomycetota bacterium]